MWSNVGSATAVGGFKGVSGGGASRVFPLPGYQSAAGLTQVTDSAGNTISNQRLLPDVAGMVAYGGAGPTHAVFYGHDIGVRAILVLADSTVFSAEWMLTCDITHTAEASRVVGTPFTADSLAARGHVELVIDRNRLGLDGVTR